MSKRFFTAVVILISVMAFSAYSQDFPGFTKSKTGLFYKIYKIGTDTVKPQVGNYVEFDMIYHGKSHGKDSVFMNTRKMENPAPVKMFLPLPSFKGDIMEGIAMLAKGDSGVFIVNADSLFTKVFKSKRPEGIDSNGYFYFNIHLLSFQTPESMVFNEEAQIKKYVEDNKITVKPNSMGLYIVELQAGTGIKVDSGCHIKMNYKVSTLNGKELYSTYEHPEPMKFEYGKRMGVPGFEYAISTFKKGTKAKVIIPSTLAFGTRGNGRSVEPYTPLIYDVEVLDVQTKAEYDKEQLESKKTEQMKSDSLKNAEPILLAKYLKDNKITVKPLPSGLYFIPVTPGTGTKAEAGKTVKVHYTGKLLNGKVFDSSRDRGTPIEFMLGRHQVISGWDEGIAMMKQGEKALLIIPSAIGYSDKDMGVIPPYSTLVFDVELVEVK